ncbi:MAG: hypothetical protein M1355_01515 [Patescibacteria group bacterium]|nr:hypothetical protein [Patescibacteria group bacterium]MCL5093789.1 hypothetical protein [Patescibacteria group bacterium]
MSILTEGIGIFEVMPVRVNHKEGTIEVRATGSAINKGAPADNFSIRGPVCEGNSSRWPLRDEYFHVALGPDGTNYGASFNRAELVNSFRGEG